MIPKEKAKELVKKFRVEIKDMMMHGDGEGEIFYAKQCALICVDEMIDLVTTNFIPGNIQQLQEVKQEINKL
tara:strand:+ start:39 stop:254 length:216 start_codon:yes stop_codon:yes gene_type:complete